MVKDIVELTSRTHPPERHCVVSRTKYAIILNKVDFPEPVIKIAVEPKNKANQQKISKAMMDTL